MGKGLLDYEDPHWLGTVGLQSRDYALAGFEDADVVITVGYDLVEHSPENWNAKKNKKIVCIDTTSAEVDEYFQTEVDLVGDLYHILTRLAEELRDAPHDVPGLAAQRHRPRALHVGEGRRLVPDAAAARAVGDPRAMRREDLLISDVGLHKLWIARMFPAHEPNTVFIANGLAGMGIALPTAIAAKLVHPERNVITVNGDGGFLMNCQELETAVRLKTPIVNVIWENSQYGSIVWKQDKKFGRHFGVDFTNPDFVKLADAFGMPAWRCEKTDDFGRHLRHALTLDLPVADRAADRLLDRRGDLGRTRNGDSCRMSITADQEKTRPHQRQHAAVHRRRVARGVRRRHARRRGPVDRRDDRVRSPTRRPRTPPRALDAAVAAQAEWAAHAPRERGEILRRAYEALTAKADELALVMTLEMGKPLAESKAEITYASEFFRWFAEEAVRIEGRYATAPNGAGRLLTMRQPVGPCYMITPWNFPMAMGTRKIGPAIAAGCTMVVKPAQQTPLSMLALGEILEGAGLPPGVLNIVTSSKSSDVSKPIIGDARLRKLSFTGSTEVGRKLIEQSAHNILRVSMELGGNAPFLVFDDADVDAAVEGAVIAKMRNIGEACTAANRFHVAEKVQDEFTEKLAAQARRDAGRARHRGRRQGRPADRRDPARQGQGARRRRHVRRARRSCSAAPSATAPATSSTRRCSPACRSRRGC